MTGWTGHEWAMLNISEDVILEAVYHIQGRLPPPRSPYDRPGMMALLSHPDFQIVHEDEVLRNRLLAFMEPNVAMISAKYYLVLSEQRSALGRWFFKFDTIRRRQEYQALQERRDLAFKEYEMWRRLTCWDNALLRITPYA